MSDEDVIPRYCPFEDPPALCTRGCGMEPCERAVAGLPEATPAHECTCPHQDANEPDHDAECPSYDPLLAHLMAEYARERCYSCHGRLDYVPDTQPALCGECENVP